MTIQPGSRLGPYEILAPLGAGGMGEVYRARDPKLGREVAIKVLPEQLASNPEALSRFEREARVVAALSHPNILAIHDFGNAGGVTYAVMELLEGETLGHALSDGAVPLRKATEWALQIAHGLAAAHGKGIVHRDLKPDNVFVTGDGRVKVLDFGLARLTAGPALPDETRSPTVTAHTEPGAIMGTVGYMSPEQVRGLPLDARSDIYSFGAVLYEMLSGRPAFRRDTTAETMTAILREEPPEFSDWGRNIPPALDRLVRHCLEKKPEQRFQSASDIAFDLQGTSGALSQADAPAARGSGKRDFLVPVLLAATLAFVAGVWVARRPLPAASEPGVIRALTDSGHDWAPTASPDGRMVAFVSDRDGKPRIWVRQIAEGSETALTSGPDDLPRFSPDSAAVLFLRRERGHGSLYRVGLLGGEPRKLVESALDGCWSPDGRRIAFVAETREGGRPAWVLQVATLAGGEAREIFRSTDSGFDSPSWSPDGKWIAVVRHYRAAELLLVNPETKKVEEEKPNARTIVSSLAWTGDGHLILARADQANRSEASPCGVLRRDVSTGKEQTILASPNRIGALAILGQGRLVFDTYSARESLREAQLDGGAEPGSRLTRGVAMNRQPRYSPDGEWIVYTSLRGGNVDIWELSPKTGTQKRLTDDPATDFDPALTPDGKSLVWSSNRSGNFEIWMANADGTGARQITHDGVDAENATATPDGRWVVYASADPKKLGLWKIHPDGSGASQLVAGGAGRAEVSPDGRHALFVTVRVSEKLEVRVVRIEDATVLPFAIRFGTTTSRLAGVTARARWMPDGRAIAFVDVDAEGRTGIYVQDFVPGKDTQASRRPLAGFNADWATETFGISPDGSRICLAEWEQTLSIMTADGIPGVAPPSAAARN